MLFKMTLPIKKKTDDPDASGLTVLNRKQKGSGSFFLNIRAENDDTGGDFETANTCACRHSMQTH